MLHDGGFVPAIEWLASRFRDQHNLQITLSHDNLPKHLSEEVGTVLFQATRELLTNVVKHAQSSTVDLRIQRRTPHIDVQVADDGIGFDPAQALPNMDSMRGFGLFNIRERLEFLGGRVQIASGRQCGTRITLTAPLASNPPDESASQPRGLADA